MASREDPMEPIGHPVNRVMHEVRKRRTPHMVPEFDPHGEAVQAEGAVEDLSADVERIKQEQNR